MILKRNFLKTFLYESELIFCTDLNGFKSFVFYTLLIRYDMNS